MDVLEDIKNRVDIPLVLHGGSANPDEEIAKAVQIGIQKVNISSDYKYAFYKKCREILSTTELWDANAIYPECIDAAKAVVKQKWNCLIQSVKQRFIAKKTFNLGDKNKIKQSCRGNFPRLF